MSVDRRQMLRWMPLAVLSPSLAQAQGFAGLGGGAEGYARVERGREIVFPADHGAHPDFRIEWWYLTANLTDETGAAYGAQWTLFRQAAEPGPQRTGWASQQFWLAHAAVTGAEFHHHAEKLARGGSGQAGVIAEPFEAWIDGWHLASTGLAFSPLRLRAGGDAFSYDLRLETAQAMVLQGDGGYSRKSERGQASHYVSQPFFSAGGTLRIGERNIAVRGRAWMDREWSSQPLAPDQEGWDWFSLHLDSGEKVMLFRLRHSDGSAYFAGNWIGPDGRSTPIPATAIRMEPGELAKVAERALPVRWTLAIEDRGLQIATEPLNPHSWNATSFPYWEGPVTFSGTHSGVGYLEMTGYPEA